MNALTKIENTAITSMPESELMEVLQSSLYPGASLPSIKLVLGYCKAAGLDPMRKPVHIVPMWDAKAQAMRDVVMPGIGLYRTDASRTGECAGVTEPEFGPDVTEAIGGQTITFPLWCRVTVSRRMPTGEISTFTAREFWKENYAVKGGKEKSIAPNAMWTKRPYGQIAKCAEAQALRKAFPEVGSQPTADEMEGKPMDMGMADVVQPPPAPPAPTPAPVWPDEKFAAQLPRWTKAIEEGIKTHDEIITLAKSKGELTEAQVERIKQVLVLKKDDEPTGEIVMTYAQVAEKLNSAKNLDKLAEAASLISTVADEGQRKELTAIYDRRATELNA